MNLKKEVCLKYSMFNDMEKPVSLVRSCLNMYCFEIQFEDGCIDIDSVLQTNVNDAWSEMFARISLKIMIKKFNSGIVSLNLVEVVS